MSSFGIVITHGDPRKNVGIHTDMLSTTSGWFYSSLSYVMFRGRVWHQYLMRGVGALGHDHNVKGVRSDQGMGPDSGGEGTYVCVPTGRR